ncbi:MAG: CPBP family glutamic-type intramembrane protease [Microcoleus sp.]
MLNFSSIALLELLGHRLSSAISTIPNFTDWLVVGAIALIYTAIALTVGWRSGFLKIDPQTSQPTIIAVTIGCLFSPGISEEIFFRVLILPHPNENVSGLMLWFWGGLSLALFVVYHPLNALTFYPVGRGTFMNPVFLLLAALLGAACTWAYWQSSSVWPAVAIHWLAVTVWLLLLGGYKRLYG